MMYFWFAIGLIWHGGLAAEQLITKASASFDVKQSKDLLVSVEKYLSRFVTLPPSEENRLAAEAFLRSSYFAIDANCHYRSIENGSDLHCHIKSKRIVSKITIKNLPASLLESELKRKLPVQLGAALDIDKELATTLPAVKSRVETFLRKNGYYGGVVQVGTWMPENSHVIEITVTIDNGVFARVNKVTVHGDAPLSPRSITKLFKRMCLRFDRIIESVSRFTTSCYSRELERETVQSLQDRFAKKGYVQARIGVSHQWIDPHDKDAPQNCRSKNIDDNLSRCVNLRIDIDKGPKVTWSVNVKDQIAIGRNGFLRFLSSLFAVEQFSRVTTANDSENVALDHVIVKEEILKEITFVTAKNVDELEMTESANAIKRFLMSRGFTHATVVAHLSHEDVENMTVNFDVYAGQPYYIRSVRLAPEKYYDFIEQDELDKLVGHRSFSDNGHLSYEEVDSARLEIERRLLARGFVEPKVRADLEANNNGVDVVFYIVTKERQLLDEIVILNGYQQQNEEIIPSLNNCDTFSRPRRRDRQIKFCHGSSLVEGKIEEDVKRLVDYYQSHGFLYARAKSEILRGEDGIKLIFTLYDSRRGDTDFTPLNKQSIKDIIITGNESINANVIKRLFPRDRRTAHLEPIALKRGLSNLRELGNFSRIDQKILFGEEGSDDAYFMLQLAERPSLSVDMSIAFSTDQLFSLEVDVEETNLFSSLLRLNTSLGLGLFWGRQSVFNNKLVWPFIFGKPLRFTLQAPMVVYDDRTHWPEPHRRLTTKVAAALEWRVTQRFTPYIRYWLQLRQVKNYRGGYHSPTFTDRLRSLDGLIDTIKMNGDVRGVFKPGIAYTNLDNPFNPRLGIDLNFWTEISGGPFLGDPPFVNLGTQNRFYVPIGPLTLAFQATFMRAFIEPSKDNWQHLKDASSVMDNLGGDYSIRGYLDGAIGIDHLSKERPGLYSGYFANIANIEVRFPISTKSRFGNFSGAFFVDQGMVIPCSSLIHCYEGKSIRSMIENKGFGLSVGAAIRYALPVGPISLDYGVSPLTGDSRLHILFGFAF